MEKQQENKVVLKRAEGPTEPEPSVDRQREEKQG